MTPLDAALDYVGRGFAIVPIPHGQKRPIIHGWQNATFGEAELRMHLNGTGNVGVLLGERSGDLVDVDLDCMEAVELADDYLPHTDAVTGRPSRPETHRYYRARGVKTVRYKDPVDSDTFLELRGTGAQTLVGPSVHPDGETIDMLAGEPAVVLAAELAEAVEALAQAVIARRHGDFVAGKWAEQRDVAKQPAAPTPASSRRPTKPTDVVDRAAKYLAVMPPGISGTGGHAATFAAACAMVNGFDLDEQTAMGLMREFNQRCEPQWTEGDLLHKIRSAATTAHSKPLGHLLTAERNAKAKRATGQRGFELPSVDSAGQDDKPLPEDVEFTELSAAQRLVAVHGHNLLYVPAWGKFLTWTGRQWAVDDTGEVTRWAKGEARRRWSELADRPALLRARAMKFATHLESARGIENAMKLAKTEPGVPIESTALDADPLLLNTPDGTVNLKTGELRPHRQADRITKTTSTGFDPSLDIPMFRKFIEQVTCGRPALRTYLQRLLGHCLSGDVSEQALWLLLGGGSNGKSVLVDLVMRLMGGYASIAPPELLTITGRNEHPTELADLEGLRLVVASEMEESQRLKVQLVKRLTGDATVKGRRMRQDFYEFRRQFKILIASNNRPLINESTNAIWRRLKLVPFDFTVKEADRDVHLGDKLFEEEGPGILAWMVQGCVEWLEHGLVTPPEVETATAHYRDDEDSVAEFISDRLTLGAGLRIGRNDLVEVYQSWHRQSGSGDEVSRKALFNRVRRLPSVADGEWKEIGTTDKVRGFTGIALKSGGDE